MQSTYTGQFPQTRLRRLRQNPQVRRLISQAHLCKEDFILPLFIRHGQQQKQPVASMPGHYQWSVDTLAAEIETIAKLGIPGILLFGIPEHKDPAGTDSYCEQGIIQQAIRLVKDVAPELLVITDVCFCEYTDHGHCGIMNDRTGQIDLDNDATLELLAKQALSHVQAGADIVAPSGMIDGMIGTIRTALDAENYQHIPIISYAVKYCSAMYGPFREATEGAPQYGDRKSYQMDPANAAEALREAALDIAEGADMLMVKPAVNYLDIIRDVKQAHPGVPLSAYQVSGEYAMIKAAAAQGWIDERKVALEQLLSIKRAGADFIFSYFAKDAVNWLAD